MIARPALRTLRDLQRIVERAMEQAELAYEFSPGSYTHGCLGACRAAEQAVAALEAELAVLSGLTTGEGA